MMREKGERVLDEGRKGGGSILIQTESIYCVMREKGERVFMLNEGRKGGGRIFIQMESVYCKLLSLNLKQARGKLR